MMARLLLVYCCCIVVQPCLLYYRYYAGNPYGYALLCLPAIYYPCPFAFITRITVPFPLPRIAGALPLYNPTAQA